MDKLETRGHEEKERAADVVQSCFEEVEERFVGPVQILHEHDGRSLGNEVVEERHPGLPQPVARDEWMKVGGGLQP
jgi:hypothetical protein